jgi:ribonuclease Y
MSTASLVSFVLLSLVFGSVFAALGYWVRLHIGEQKIRAAETRAEEIRTASERDADRRRAELQKEGERYLLRLKHEFDETQETRRREMEEAIVRSGERERAAQKEMDEARAKEREAEKTQERAKTLEAQMEKRKNELEQMIHEEQARLQDLSGLGSEDAKRQLLRRMETEVRVEASRMIKTVEEEAREMADKKAKNIVAQAIQRCAAELSIEQTVSVVHLPGEEMKGRIIGKEGRNIRTFEQATGVDVVIDETPGAVVLSSFDPVRREVARLALERLIEDGRIHPSSIEETVGKTRQELDKTIQAEGAAAALEIGVSDMHPDLVMMVGKLKYRTSYGQNSLSHAKEVADIMNVFAGQLGLDALTARRAGLLHDIGKTVSHDVEGPHALIGGELARKYGEPEDVIHAIEAHHEDISPKSVWPILLQAADSISASRPGARRETIEQHLHRMEKLEKIARSIPGVESVFAIQAGRELRVLVNPNEVADAAMPALAREITKAVRDQGNFPGQIRVTVVRETRAIEFARAARER